MRAIPVRVQNKGRKVLLLHKDASLKYGRFRYMKISFNENAVEHILNN